MIQNPLEFFSVKETRSNATPIFDIQFSIVLDGASRRMKTREMTLSGES